MNSALPPDELRDRLRPVFARYQVQQAILFGSRARGEATRRSDVDLIVIQETDKRFLDRYDGLLAALITAANCDVDLLIYTPEEMEAISHRRFIQRALLEGQVIYERK